MLEAKKNVRDLKESYGLKDGLALSFRKLSNWSRQGLVRAHGLIGDPEFC